MDGLSAGAALISAVTLGLLSLSAHPPGAPGVFLCALMAVSLLGFWWHNRAPASIFMGDSGSLATGYMLAVLSVPGSLNGHFGMTAFNSLFLLLVPGVALSVFVFDAVFVSTTRFIRALKIYRGGFDHSSHRLVRLGFSEKQAVLILQAIACSGGLIALLTRIFPEQILPLVGLFVLALFVFGAYLGQVRLTHDPGPSNTVSYTHLTLPTN